MYKKKFGLFLFVLAILVLVIAVPVYANGKDPIGTRVNLLAGDQAVSGPFHVFHGSYTLLPNELPAFGKTDFTLEIDGVEQNGRFVNYVVDGALIHGHLYNFPDGLPAGTYNFKGTWVAPCGWVYNDCDHKNELEPFVEEITVTVN